MNKKMILCAAVSVVLLSGCSNVSKALTQSKAAPDEFSVYTRAPLSVPPDYGLRPPSSSQGERNQSARIQEKVRRVLLNDNARKLPPVKAATPGTAALLARAGVQNAVPNIRTLVNRETSIYAREDQTFMDKLMNGDNPDRGTVVDPRNEAKRIQENQALGRPITEGKTPMIKTKPKAPLEGVFKGLFN